MGWWNSHMEKWKVFQTTKQKKVGIALRNDGWWLILINFGDMMRLQKDVQPNSNHGWWNWEESMILWTTGITKLYNLWNNVFSWEKSQCPWPFSIANCWITSKWVVSTIIKVFYGFFHGDCFLYGTNIYHVPCHTISHIVPYII